MFEIFQQRADPDHSRHRRALGRVTEGLVVDQSFPDFHNVHIPVLNLPELAWLQLLPAFYGFGLHIN